MDEHPLVTQSRERLAAYEHRTPPGYPIAYNLHRHKFSCTGCGASAEFSTLTTVDRAGASSKSYHNTSPKERVFDLPIGRVNSYYTTPRCAQCIDILPKEPVPVLPPLNKKIGISQKGKELDIDLSKIKI